MLLNIRIQKDGVSLTIRHQIYLFIKYQLLAAATAHASSPLRISIMRIADTGIRVPGPKIAATPAL